MKPVTVGTASLIFSDVRILGFWMSRWYEENRGQKIDQMFAELSELALKNNFKEPAVIKIKPEEFKLGMEGTLKGQKLGKYLIDFT